MLFVQGVKALSLASHGYFTLVNRVRNPEEQLPAAAMVSITLHVWPSQFKGLSVLRIGVKGNGTFSLRGKVNSDLITMFDIHKKWNRDEVIWSSEPEDDLDFAKIQSVADYIENFGINFSKNLSQLDPNLLLAIPLFLADVANEVV